MWALLAGFVLLTVSVVRIEVPPQMTRLSFNFLVGYGAGLFFAALVAARSNFWVGAFLAVCLYHSFYPYHSDATLEAAIAVTIGVAWFYSLFECKVSADIILFFICLVASINALFVVMQASSGNLNFPGVGLLANKNEVAALIGISLPAFYRKYYRALLPLVLAGLIGSQSFGGLAAAGVGTVVFGLYHKWRVIPALAAVAAGVAYYYLVDKPGTSVRSTLFQMGLVAWKEEPFIGYGLGHWQTLFRRVTIDGIHTIRAHNEFIQLLVEAPVAMIPVLGFLASAVTLSIKKSAKAAVPMSMLAALVVSCNVHFVFHIAVTAILGATILAIVQLTLGGGEDPCRAE